MARYDLYTRMFETPKGVPVLVWLREGTNDHNTAQSALNEDEYGLRNLALSGLALDIGAHIGTVTVGLAVDNPDLRVIALEPIPENLAILRKNLDAAGVADRVTVVEGMAGIPGQGLVRYAFHHNETALHHAFIGNSTIAVPEGDHTVIRPPVYALGDLLVGPAGGMAYGEYYRADVEFMKIDCEGGEYAFFEASSDGPPSHYPLRRVRLIIGEWHPNAPDNGHKTQQDILDLLSPTHDVTFSGPDGGPGGFRAVRR